ncbi:hypothetical protein EDD22DRAFT_994485 [Suillus occidentalis]|nr:hypothetical protein EDD22DRAFT_994485 [Suillus occidentalis]
MHMPPKLAIHVYLASQSDITTITSYRARKRVWIKNNIVMSEFDWQASYTHGQPTSGQPATTWSGLSYPESGQLQVQQQSQPESNLVAHDYGSTSTGINYDGYTNTVDFRLEQPTQSHGPGFQHFASGNTAPTQGWQSHNTITDSNIHLGDHLEPSSSSQHGSLLPHSFPDRHHSDHTCDFSASHGANIFQPAFSNNVSLSMSTRPLPSDTYHHPTASRSLITFQPPMYNDISRDMSTLLPPSDTFHPTASGSSNTFQPAMSNDISRSMSTLPPPSDTFHPTAPRSSNTFQPAMSNDSLLLHEAPSDPTPEVTIKLTKGTRKTKCASTTRTKFLGSKYIPQISSLPTPPSLKFLTPKFLRDLKVEARTSMFKALFQENLFPSTNELSTIAQNMLDTTVTRHCQTPSHRLELTRWKSGSDAKSCIATLKGVLKEIHGDFEEIALLTWVAAYHLSLDITRTRDEMYAARVARLTTLLTNYFFADKIVETNHPGNHASPMPVALAATSREWSLELALAGPWSAAQRLHTEENRVRFNKMKSRLDELPMEEFSSSTFRPANIHLLASDFISRPRNLITSSSQTRSLARQPTCTKHVLAKSSQAKLHQRRPASATPSSALRHSLSVQSTSSNTAQLNAALHNILVSPMEAHVITAQQLAQKCSGTQRTRCPSGAALDRNRSSAALKTQDPQVYISSDMATEFITDVFDKFALVNFDAWKAKARKILRGLGFEEAQADARVQTLSGGWRMQIALAKALFVGPDTCQVVSGPSTLAAERHPKAEAMIIVQAQVSSRPLRSPTPITFPVSSTSLTNPHRFSQLPSTSSCPLARFAHPATSRGSAY